VIVEEAAQEEGVEASGLDTSNSKRWTKKGGFQATP